MILLFLFAAYLQVRMQPSLSKLSLWQKYLSFQIIIFYLNKLPKSEYAVRKERIFITGCQHREKKLGEKWITFLKGHLDSFKHANLISQAPEYI